MSPAALLVIVVAAGDAGDATTLAMQDAAREALAGAGAVELRTLGGRADADLLAVQRATGARAVARLSWRDAERTRAQLRVHISTPDQWIDREIAFSSTDTPEERGRTLGFAAAAMLLVIAPELAPTPDVAAAPPAAETVAVTPAPPVRGAPGRYAALLLGTGTGGLSAAWAWGGALGFERFLRDDFAVSGGVGARAGSVESFAGTSVVATLALGGAFWVRPPTVGRRFSLGLRGEVLALYNHFSRTTAMGATEARSQWLPGLRLVAEVGWQLAQAIDLLVAAGPELALGAIDLEVRNQIVATVPALRSAVSAGVRWRF